MTPGRTVSNLADGSKQNRACQACRVSKVRCNKSDDDQSCARCSKTGRSCVPFEESNKRQKRLDSRAIDDIESRLELLAAALRQQGESTPAVERTAITERTAELDLRRATTSLNTDRVANALLSTPTVHLTAQIEASLCSIIDDETTSMIFDHFIENMLQHFPFIAIPSGSTAEDIRRDKPLLLLAIMDAAGDGYCDMKASRQLRRLLVQNYSRFLLDGSTNSTCVIQAFVVSVSWYRDLVPLQAEEQVDVFHISRAAANMAIDMSLNTRLRDWSWNNSLPIQADSLRGAASEYQFSTLEVRRIWLACYHICSNTSSGSQTPNLMPWNRQMDECLEVLEASPAALASDKVLCAHVRLQHILEEAEIQLSSSYGQTAINIAHRVANRQLAEWTTMLHILNDSLRTSQQFVTLYIQELAMTTTPSVDHTLGNGEDAVIISSSEFSDCLTATHNSLNFFLFLEMPFIRTLPTSYFVQLTHTALVLVKLHFAAARLSDHADARHKISDTRADAFLKRLLTRFCGWGTLWPAQKLAETLSRLRSLLRQCGDENLASELAWLNAWTLEERSCPGIFYQIDRVPEQSGDINVTTISEGSEVGEKATLATFDKDALAWCVSGTDQINTMQDVTRPALPSASLDATQLIDWFGTDLNTSTFDFDGNLQFMTQFFG